MNSDTNPKTIYSESTLIDYIKKELDKSGTNYSLCLKYMKNLGQLSAAKDKEIDDFSYKSLFTYISTIFRRADEPTNNVPLSLRIICIKLLTNLCIVLHSRQHESTSRYVYSLIINEIENEVKKGNYNVSFIISILDAVYLCSQAECIDDKLTIQNLLKLKDILNGLSTVNRDSLAIAIDIDLVPFNQKYKYGAQAKDMNSILLSLGCTKMLSESKTIATFTIPEPMQITTLETRLAAQDFLKSLTATEIAERVMNGFEKFKKIENYQPPSTTADLIKSLIEGPEDTVNQQQSMLEAAIYMVEQALDKLSQRTKYIPLEVQSEFIAMLITTLDSTMDGYEECSGPATQAALKRAIGPDQVLVGFLISWASFEFVRSSQNRYENLVIETFTNLVETNSNMDMQFGDDNPAEPSNSNEDNFLSDFIKNLECLPIDLYTGLVPLCSERPDQSNKILNAINEYIKSKISIAANEHAYQSMTPPTSLDSFMNSLLELSVHPLPKVHDQAISIIKTYYKRKNEQIVAKVNKFAIENLQKSVTEENPEPFLELFFAIIELNMSLFLCLMDTYAASSSNLRKILRGKLKKKIHLMPYDITVIKKALEMALNVKPKTVLMHFYLSELAKVLSVPPDLVELLKKQFETSKDPRYLVPIIQNLNEEEFKLFLPSILTLKEIALSCAINSLLKAQHPPMIPSKFLIELHKPEIAGKNKANAIEAMKICLSASEYDYPTVCIAVDVAQTNKYHDMIMDTLSEMVKKFPNQGCHKFILNHIFPPLINNGITEIDEAWQLMKKLIFDTKPLSCKVALFSFTLEQIVDLINSYPELKPLLQATAKKFSSKIPSAVQDAINRSGGDVEPAAPADGDAAGGVEVQV